MSKDLLSNVGQVICEMAEHGFLSVLVNPISAALPRDEHCIKLTYTYNEVVLSIECYPYDGREENIAAIATIPEKEITLQTWGEIDTEAWADVLFRPSPQSIK